MARLVDFACDIGSVAGTRVRRMLGIVDQQLEAAAIGPTAIPERVAVPVLEAVALEDREEMQELWAQLLVASAKGLPVDAFFIDIVRKLDPLSSRVLAVVVDAEAASIVRFPAAVPGERGSDLQMFRRHRSEYLLEALATAVPDVDARGLALARLLALGLMTSSMIRAVPDVAPAGLHLLRLLDPRAR